jgi:hypothetical protein
MDKKNEELFYLVAEMPIYKKATLTRGLYIESSWLVKLLRILAK